jgi:glycosyltransferase involved in cell wall biosynthesis
MKNNKIFVTVLMPVFNAEKHLIEAIISILNQTYIFFEFIIINDGSIDDSENIILSFNDNRIIYIKNEINLGLIKTLNLGFSLAKGKYLVRMDSDDISDLKRLEKQLEYMESNPEIGLLGSNFIIFGDQNEYVKYPKDNDEIKIASIFYNPFCHPSVMIRKEIIDKNQLLFNQKYLHAEDYRLWTEFLKITKVHNLQDFLLNYRSHSAQVSKVHLKIQNENSIKAQNELLLDAGFKFTEIELTDMKNAFKNAYTKECDEVIRQLIVLEKLIIQNKDIRFFNSRILKLKLHLFYKNIILNSKFIDKKVYKKFNDNLFNNEINWTLKQQLSIIYRFTLTNLKLKLKLVGLDL